MTKRLVVPNLADLFEELKNEIFASLNCVKIGEIQSFDGAKKTATIQLKFKRKINGEIKSMPLLVDCPVVTIQGGGGALQMPIKTGDNCLVFFSDRNIDIWFESGIESVPEDNRKHDLSDGIALVGLNSQVSDLIDYESNVTRLIYKNCKFSVNSDGKANVQNSSKSLLGLIEGLIDVIKAITVGTVPLDASSIAALEAYKAQFQQLLYKD